MKIDHIGIATKSIERTAALYEQLGFRSSDTILDPIQGVRISFLSKENHPLLELVEPVDVSSPVMGILGKNGTTPYHTCYEVVELEKAIEDFRKMKFVPVTKPVPAIAFDGRKIVFLYHNDAGLIELVEEVKK